MSTPWPHNNPSRCCIETVTTISWFLPQYIVGAPMYHSYISPACNDAWWLPGVPWVVARIHTYHTEWQRHHASLNIYAATGVRTGWNVKACPVPCQPMTPADSCTESWPNLMGDAWVTIAFLCSCGEHSRHSDILQPARVLWGPSLRCAFFLVFPAIQSALVSTEGKRGNRFGPLHLRTDKYALLQ